MASSAQSTTIWELTEPDQERMCVVSTSVSSRPSLSTLIGGREVGVEILGVHLAWLPEDTEAKARVDYKRMR
jgi:hypothetical protein